MLFRHFHTLPVWLKPPGDDERGDVVLEQLVKGVPPFLGGPPLQIGGLHQADYLEPFLPEIVKEAGELQARPVDILSGNLPIFPVLSTAKHLQVKFLHQAAQLSALRSSHTAHPFSVWAARPTVCYSMDILRDFIIVP